MYMYMYNRPGFDCEWFFFSQLAIKVNQVHSIVCMCGNLMLFMIFEYSGEILYAHLSIFVLLLSLEFNIWSTRINEMEWP